ncbi:integral membrane protein [Phialemonium atrogriseum]|uniref:Integral membrane protein n=1 Tax=Phialemonium atrogriseum TaxID=1093897 RepID=A0AAJ0BVZ3_9PEZI|nr:uncharacterized protein QBC33DRAFT_517058 [Phialemonium atrogriseum]KAK1765295.1 integral membrane protein [Phialemonium atrogriseum]
MTWVQNATPEVDAQSEYPTIIAVCSVLSVLSIATVSTRLWIRFSGYGLWADDWFSALSMTFALIYSILCIVQTRLGLGLPIALRPEANLVLFTRVNFAGRPIYQIGVSFFKIALLVSYLRLFKGTNQMTYRRLVWGCIVLVFAAHLACTFALVFACSPIDKSWNPLKEGSCLPSGPSFRAYAIVTILCDVIVAVLPVPVLLRLNIHKNKKVALIGIFLLGLFTTICSILRCIQINRIQYGDGNSTQLVLWGTVEFNVGNMVSSLPFLAPAFMRRANEYVSNSKGESRERSRHLGAGGSQAYKLSSVNRCTAFVSGHHNDSDENILVVQQPDNSIIKSVTYTVRVEDEEDAIKRDEPRAL